MKSNIRIINQQIDTLKFHYYPTDDLSQEEIHKYNNFVTQLKELKNEAQSIQDTSNDNRFVKTNISNMSFNVMAQTIKMFQVNLIGGEISMALRQIKEKGTNPILKVEFRSEYLTRFGYVFAINQINSMIKTFLPSFHIKVSEIHLATDLQGYNFRKIDKDRFGYRSRTSTDHENGVSLTLHGTQSKIETMSFGKGDFMCRVYNKTKQIKKVKKAGYVQALRWETNEDYNEYEDVWRVEFQLRRKYLKTLSGKNGKLDGFLEVLNEIPSIWSLCINRFVHYNLTDKQCTDLYLENVTSNTHKKRKQRAGKSKVWETIQYFNENENIAEITKDVELSKPESEYVINAYKSVASTFVKLARGGFNIDDLSSLLHKAEQKHFEKTGLTILDSARLKTLDYINKSIIDEDYETYYKDTYNNIKLALSTLENPTQKRAFQDELIKRDFPIYNNVDCISETWEYE
jgi:hypothetical protein